MRLAGWSAVALCALCALWPGRAQSEEWPGWRGPRGDGISHESVPDAWPSQGPKRCWQVPVGPGYASPIAQAGRVYLFDQESNRRRETLTAYAAESGKVLWRESSDGGFDLRPIDGYPGTRATPTIDGSAQTITTFGGGGDLIRRDLGSGALRWKINVVEQAGASPLPDGACSSPLIAGNRIFVQAGKDGPIAVAVDANSGRVLWKSSFRGDSGVAPALMAEVQGRPVLVVLGKDDVVGMDPATGATRWSRHWPGAMATPIVQGDRLVLTSQDGPGMALWQLGATSARDVWTNARMNTPFVSPVLDGGVLYGNNRGTLKAVHFASGALAWSAPKADLQLGPGGALLRTGDKLILLGDHGLLSMVRATPQGYQKLAQSRLFQGDNNWATPLLYRGRLYVRGDSQLVCLELGPPP